MTSAATCVTRNCHGLLAGLLLALLVPVRLAWAQPGAGTQTEPPAQAQQPKDPLGRDTPRGTVIGFMTAARSGSDELSPQFLNTDLKGTAALELARQLFVVLDSRLPARLNQLSDRPEGVPTNPLRPDENVVGTINTANGSFDVVVERITRRNSAPVWLFSRRTLSFVPDAYAEVNLVRLDRFIPDALARPRIFGIRLLEWLGLLLLVPLYRLLAALDWLAAPLVGFALRRLRVPAGRADHRVVRLVRLVVMGIAIRWTFSWVDLPLFERQFWSVVSGLMLLVAVAWSLLLVNAYAEGYLGRRFLHTRDITLPLRLARRTADVLVIAACGVFILRRFGIDPTAALAGLGIGGIAVALAAQKTLENVIAGLSLIFDKAVSVGDTLKFGESVGTVDHIGLRSTRIRTLDRTILSVPNGQIASVGIETLSVRDKYWFHHMVGLQYGTTAEQMRSVVEDVRTLLLTNASVDAESARVRFFRLGAFSLDVEVSAYITAADWAAFLTIQQDLLLRIMDAIERAGTAIAFPSQTLHIADGSPPSPHEQLAAPAKTPPGAPVKVAQSV